MLAKSFDIQIVGHENHVVCSNPLRINKVGLTIYNRSYIIIYR